MLDQEPKLWYGIGILYDRYGSLEHAEEAFSQVMRMQPDFEKANEIYFRLGIIYKQQQKFQQSLEVRGMRLHQCLSLNLSS
jgi:glucose repression mediator protein